jgi:prolyl 4-hydroxylase
MTVTRTDPQQRFAEGLELLKPERGPASWQQGIGLIESASADGLGEASAQCAVFEAMGVGRVSNWEKAFDRLAQAAEQGWTRAQEELRLLARSATGSWRDLRRGLSIDDLLSAPPVELLSESPRIGMVRKFATPEECAWLIQCARDTLAPSTIYDFKTGELRQDPKRTNSYTACNPLDVGIIAEVIRARLSRTIGLPLAHYEMSQILHYSVGQEFRPHHDYFDPAHAGFQQEIATLGQRVATQLIFLNQEFEGGETQFPSIGLTFRGGTGDALMFFNINEAGDPEPLTLHTGLPPTEGQKWTFSQWIRERRPRPPPATKPPVSVGGAGSPLRS